MAGAGLDRSTGEAGRSLLERLWARPSCDVNGIWGGYTGEGAKTVIAAKASAKLSCRLVPDQDPAAVMAGLERFFAERRPAGCRLDFTPMGAAGAIRVPTGSPSSRRRRRCGRRDIPSMPSPFQSPTTGMAPAPPNAKLICGAPPDALC